MRVFKDQIDGKPIVCTNPEKMAYIITNLLIFCYEFLPICQDMTEDEFQEYCQQKNIITAILENIAACPYVKLKEIKHEC